jgi:hypothetical protein
MKQGRSFLVLVTKIKKIIMSAIIEEFSDYRSKMNEKLADNNKNSETNFQSSQC